MKITVIQECRFGLDGGAMFGIIPKPLWERAIKADSKNRIPLTTRCVVIQHAGHTILIDTGMGDKWSAKEQQIFAVDHSNGSLIEVLKTSNIDPESITDVIITHLHFDHAGGLTRVKNGAIVPTFPQAQHWIQRKNWLWAQSPSQRDAGSYRSENFNFFGAPNAPKLNLLDGNVAFLPQIQAISSDGHTPGMQLVRMQWRKNQTLVYSADLVPTAAHVRLPYVMGYDCFPLTTVQEKRALLSEAAEKGWILILEHDPNHAFIRVARKNNDFKVIARANNLEELIL